MANLDAQTRKDDRPVNDEVGQRLQSSDTFILRKPIGSTGDSRGRRTGPTRHERAIRLPLIGTWLGESGFGIERARLRVTAAALKGARKAGVSAKVSILTRKA